MAFTKEHEYKVEVLPDRTLQVRRSDIVKEDGVVVGTRFHRHVVVPGADVTNEATVVQLIANAIHDSATVAAYQAANSQEAFEAAAGGEVATFAAADVPRRARNADGTYIGDDPSTPNVNEAWEDGEPPAKGKGRRKRS